MPIGVPNALFDRFLPVAGRRAGAAVGLWGPAGSGKTHALQSLRASLTCPSDYRQASEPPATWIAAWPRARRLAPWAARSLERLAAGESVGTLDASAAMLEAWSGSAPFVLCVDDMDGADASSLALLQALARGSRRVRGAGLLVAGRHRPPAPFAAWRIDRLSDADAAQVIRAAIGSDPPAPAAAWLLERGSGNPSVLLEYLRHVRREGALWHDGDRWRWRSPDPERLPRTLEASFERTVAGLSAACRRLVDACAFVPERAPAEVAFALSGMEGAALADALAEARHRGVLDAGGPGHAFAHPDLRTVALRQIDVARRRAMARTVVAIAPDRPG